MNIWSFLLEEHLHALCDRLPAEWATVMLGVSVVVQPVSAAAAEAEVTAGQQQNRFASVLTNDTLLPLLVLF